MSRPWLDADERARAVTLSDAVSARMGSAFKLKERPGHQADSAAFRAVRSLAVADIVDVTPGARGVLRGGRAIRDAEIAEAEQSAASAAARLQLEAQAMAEARAAYDAELGAALDHARQLIRNLGQARAIDGDALAGGLRALVLGLVEQIVEAHVAADPGFVTSRVDQALADLKTRQEPGRLAVHPQDLELLDVGARYPNLTVVGDASLPRGSLRLLAGGAEIADGPDVRIAQLRAAQ